MASDFTVRVKEIIFLMARLENQRLSALPADSGSILSQRGNGRIHLRQPPALLGAWFSPQHLNVQRGPPLARRVIRPRKRQGLIAWLILNT